MTRIDCPSCAKTFQAADSASGEFVRCPRCGVAVPVSTIAPAIPPSGGPHATISYRPAQEPGEDRGDATLSPGHGRDNTLSDASPLKAVSSRLVEFLAPPLAADELGRLGTYRVLKVLGHGGMGVVYLAEDETLKRKVALKAMLPHVAADEASARRFLREAQAAAALKHDHVVTIFQVGEERGAPYLAMELLEGEPLDVRLKRERMLPLADILRIGREIADGLAAAHDRGLIHRDIKPGNIWLEKRAVRPRSNDAASLVASSPSADYRTKIVDFGLVQSTSDQMRLTQPGAIVGSPAYMSPEQAAGRPIDHRSDLFSLGSVLYRMATGTAPFKRPDLVATVSALALETPADPTAFNSALPTDLSDLIMRLLSKDPKDRPASGADVAEALARIADNSRSPAMKNVTPSSQAAPASSNALTAASEPNSSPRPRFGWGHFAAVGGLLAVAAGVGFVVLDHPQSETQRGKEGVEAIRAEPRIALPAVEYADLVRGGKWISVLASEADFKRLMADNAFVDEPPTFENGELTLSGKGGLRISVAAKDCIVRAKVKHIEGSNITLGVRARSDVKLAAIADDDRYQSGIFSFFNRGVGIGIGAHQHGRWQELSAVPLAGDSDDFLEYALAAVGPKVTVFIDGRPVVEATDSDAHAGFLFVGVTASVARFREIQYQNLDRRPIELK